ncbi:MAG: hypothetical protein QUS08_09935, partial [Methanothrix sp.]|nr:hypothetical protein [Methanothrix sp.]
LGDVYKRQDVGLNVFDVSSRSFRDAGRLSYTNVSRWELLEWPQVQPASEPGAEGPSYYYFSFYYRGSEAPFSQSEHYAGPDLILIEFRNATVDPASGGKLSAFSCSVEAETALPRCDIELQTSPPGETRWSSQGMVTYDGSSRVLTWSGIRLGGSTSGTARYRFVCGQTLSEEFLGPDLVVPEVNGRVTPARGVIQAFPETNSLYSFTYMAELMNWTGEEEIWAELLVKPPNSSWMAVGERRQFDPANGSITWTVKPFTDLGFLGEASFKFVLNGEESQVFQGPEIFAVYRDLNFKKNALGTYDYMASVIGSEDLTVDLLWSTDNEHWTAAGRPRSYRAGSGWTELVWENMPAYYFYEIDVKSAAKGGSR